MFRFVVFLLMTAVPCFAQTCEPLLGQNPFLYQIQNASGETKGYLLGTMHVATSLDSMPRFVRKKVQESSDITVEYAMNSFWPMMYLIVKSLRWGGPTISDLVSPEAAADFEKVTGEPLAKFNRVNPGMMSAVFTKLMMDKDPDFKGYPTGEGIDSDIMKLAKKRQLPLYALDDFKTIRSVFKLLSQPEYISKIEDTFENAPKTKAELLKLIRDYHSGDEAEVQATLGSVSKSMTDELLGNRNRHWLPKMTHTLSMPGVHTFAVGVGHLLGPEGLIELLRSEGFKMDRVTE
jgi:uncharacterized protein YbaP (TraB family)